jgi:putative molybdopterin biosynthesis protein
MRVHSRLKEFRRRQNLAAADLAAQCGVSRQTIYAIESGAFVPNTAVALKLARLLHTSVDELFSLEGESAWSEIDAALLANAPVHQGGLADVCTVNGNPVAIPKSPAPAYLPHADGFISSLSGKGARVAAFSGLAGESGRLVLAGCDPALPLLDRFLRRSGMEVVIVPCSSRRALDWLKQGRIHAAGSHLFDPKSGSYNLAIVKRLLPRANVRVVTFAAWDEGLLVTAGNPKGIRSIADLAAKGVTMINREIGSGSRDLLDRSLRELGIPPRNVAGYERIAPGHLPAAAAVAAGAADCCIAPRSAARCFDLMFIPLTTERFDLVFSRSSWNLPVTQAILDALNSSAFARQLQALAGYDSTSTGKILM